MVSTPPGVEGPVAPTIELEAELESAFGEDAGALVDVASGFAHANNPVNRIEKMRAKAFLKQFTSRLNIITPT